MEVITTHTNADFDAFASMVAAKRLYPDAKVVFSGSQEKWLRDFLNQVTPPVLEFDKLKTLDMDKISRLILVDTKSPGRIGKFSEILGRQNLSIHIYDHHPFTEGDLRGDFELIEKVGATSTIFTEIMKKRNIAITPMEATILALGIYEETGSLMFASTTERDILAVAYLLKRGANLNIVSDFIVKELDAEQINLLNELLETKKNYVINGIPVTIAIASRDSFSGDIAIIAHKLRDMEGTDVLFVIIRMEERIHMIARSRIPEVDVGEIVSRFGGGGHAFASSATIKNMTITEVEEQLIKLLKILIRPQKIAKDIMTTPVKTITKDLTVKEAETLMTQYAVNVLPVIDGDVFSGIISREVVEKAIYHGFGKSEVSQFMTTDVYTASSDTPVSHIEELMIEHNQRFTPVVEKKRIIGAITRTDILRSLHEEMLRRSKITGDEIKERAYVPEKNIANLMYERLPEKVIETLRIVGSIADEMDINAYLVGGFVRDILMGYENLDIDIVVEGDGIAFANNIASKMQATVKSHQKFGTAVVMLMDGLKLDIATARTEYYDSPAALPRVETSSIKKDLYRRDFTINTLAIKLNLKDYGNLIDFFGGQRDIKDRVIRILHNLSFIEDPTRAFRAIRFEQRFNFRISKHTANLIKIAVNMNLFDRLSGPRLYGELVLIFSEVEPLKAVKKMNDFNLLGFIHPSLRFTKELHRLFESINETLSWYKLLYLESPLERWLIYFIGLIDGLTDKEVIELCNRLSVPDRIKEKIYHGRQQHSLILNELSKDKGLKPSRIYELLNSLSLEILLFMMAKAKNEYSKRYISLYLTELRKVKISLTGRDIEKLGIKPGPVYKEIQRKLLEGRLDSVLTNRNEEIAFIKKNYSVM